MSPFLKQCPAEGQKSKKKLVSPPHYSAGQSNKIKIVFSVAQKCCLFSVGMINYPLSTQRNRTYNTKWVYFFYFLQYGTAGIIAGGS